MDFVGRSAVSVFGIDVRDPGDGDAGAEGMRAGIRFFETMPRPDGAAVGGIGSTVSKGMRMIRGDAADGDAGAAGSGSSSLSSSSAAASKSHSGVVKVRGMEYCFAENGGALSLAEITKLAETMTAAAGERADPAVRAKIGELLRAKKPRAGHDQAAAATEGPLATTSQHARTLCEVGSAAVDTSLETYTVQATGAAESFASKKTTRPAEQVAQATYTDCIAAMRRLTDTSAGACADLASAAVADVLRVAKDCAEGDPEDRDPLATAEYLHDATHVASRLLATVSSSASRAVQAACDSGKGAVDAAMGACVRRIESERGDHRSVDIPGDEIAAVLDVVDAEANELATRVYAEAGVAMSKVHAAVQAAEPVLLDLAARRAAEAQ
jgi:hypothetical protein